MNNKEQLMTAVVTTMLGEEKYYGSTDNEIVQLATELCKKHPEFVSNLACFACEASAFTRQTIRNVVKRPDDITEIHGLLQDHVWQAVSERVKARDG